MNARPAGGTGRPSRWLRQTIFSGVILLLIAGAYWRRHQLHRQAAATGEDQHYAESFQVMGTIATVQFWEEDPERSKAAAAKVKEVFAEVNRRFSNYNPESELSRLNASAYERPFTCSDEMWDLLQECRAAYGYTHGAFDISAGPLVKLWGIYRKEKKTLPTAAEIDAARARVGLDKVVFNEEARTVKFTVAGMYLDVGGIAKGYAVDQAADALMTMGIRRGIIDLAGNIYCFPDAPAGREQYFIHIRNPRTPKSRVESIGRVPMTAMAVATSGDYERFVVIDGKRYAHIMNPVTGRPVEGIASVSVLAHRATVADALSTGIFVNGGKYLTELQARFPELNVLIVEDVDDGKPTLIRFPEDNRWGQIREPENW